MYSIAHRTLALTALAGCLAIGLVTPAAADPQKILDYCTARPERCALSVLALDDGWERHLNPDRPQSLASTFKIHTLLAYALAVEAGAVDPDMELTKEEWARYLTLGVGAFESSWNDLGQPDRVRLDDLVRMMIVHSDNATPDWLLANLAKKWLKRANRAFDYHDFPASLGASFGLWLGATGEEGVAARLVEDYGGFGVKSYQRELTRLFKTLRKPAGVDRIRESLCIQPPWETGPPPCMPTDAGLSVAAYRTLVREYFTRSTSRSYAALLAALLDGSLLGDAAQEVVDRHLEVWLDIFPTLSPAFSRYGLKGGSLNPSGGNDILTWAHFMETGGDGRRYVVVVLLQRLLEPGKAPEVIDIQDFAQRIALDSSFRETVRQTLDADDERPELVASINSAKRQAGSRVQMKVRVENVSPHPVEGPFTVALLVSDGADPANDELLATETIASLGGYQGQNVTLSGAAAADPRGLLAVVHVDADGEVAESSEENNLSWQRLK